MSWSIDSTGTPEEIKAELNAYSEELDEGSKEEFDAALPFLIGLVEQNHDNISPPSLSLSANGHGYEGHNECRVTLQ